MLWCEAQTLQDVPSNQVMTKLSTLQSMDLFNIDPLDELVGHSYNWGWSCLMFLVEADCCGSHSQIIWFLEEVRFGNARSLDSLQTSRQEAAAWEDLIKIIKKSQNS